MPTENLSADARARVEEIRRLAAAVDVEALLSRLTEPSWAVRRVVVSSLAEIGQPAVEPLARVLAGQRDDETRIAAAVDALGLSRGAVDAALAGLAESEDPAVVCDALQLYGRRRTASAVDRIAALALHADDNVGLAAIEALGRIGGDTVVDPLVEALRSGNFFRRFPAIDALGRSGDPRAVPPLVALLGDAPYAVDAARALGRAGDVGAVRPLARTLGKGSDALRRASAAALVDIDDRVHVSLGEGVRGEFLAGIEEKPTVVRRLLALLAQADASEKAALSRLVAWLGGDEAVEALVELLSGDAVAASAAAEALRSLGPSAEAPLTRALRDPDNEGAVRARLLPLVSGRRGARDAVLTCLDDESSAVRVLACGALASMGDPSVVGRLFELLGDPDDLVAHAAAAAIQALGSAETEARALVAARSNDPRVRRAAIRIISYFGYPTGLEPLLEAATGDDDRVRDAAITGLAYLEDERALAAVLALAAHPSSGTRAAAARALGRAGPGAAVTARLAELVRDADAWVRYYACQSIARLGDAGFVAEVARLVDDPAGQVRIVALETLARLRGDASFEVLAAAARAGDADMRRAALTGLGLVATDASFEVLREAAATADPATRLVALSALAQHRALDVVDVLAGAMADVDSNVRRAAIALLTERGEPAADARLVAGLTEPLDREIVIGALAQPSPGRVAVVAAALAGAEAELAGALVAVLIRAHRAEASAALDGVLKNGGVHARRAAAAALVAARSKSARALLTDVAQHDSDPTVRSIAASGLEPL